MDRYSDCVKCFRPRTAAVASSLLAKKRDEAGPKEENEKKFFFIIIIIGEKQKKMIIKTVRTLCVRNCLFCLAIHTENQLFVLLPAFLLVSLHT
jgi:Zn-finger protein